MRGETTSLTYICPTKATATSKERSTIYVTVTEFTVVTQVESALPSATDPRLVVPLYVW